MLDEANRTFTLNRPAGNRFFRVFADKPTRVIRIRTAGQQPAAVVGLLAAIAIPNFVKARETAQYNSILNNLRMIEGAKDQWALENKKRTGDPVTEQNLSDYLRGGKINPVAGETYHLNPVGTPATATLSRKIMNHPAGSLIRAE